VWSGVLGLQQTGQGSLRRAQNLNRRLRPLSRPLSETSKAFATSNENEMRELLVYQISRFREAHICTMKMSTSCKKDDPFALTIEGTFFANKEEKFDDIDDVIGLLKGTPPKNLKKFWMENSIKYVELRGPGNCSISILGRKTKGYWRIDNTEGRCFANHLLMTLSRIRLGRKNGGLRGRGGGDESCICLQSCYMDYQEPFCPQRKGPTAIVLEKMGQLLGNIDGDHITDLITLFIQAENNFRDVRRQRSKPSLEKQNDLNKSLFRAARSMDSYRQVKELVFAGANVNMVQRDVPKFRKSHPGSASETPLMIAAHRARAQNVAMLILLGADIHAQDDEGYTSVSHLCAAGTNALSRVHALRLLLLAHADPNPKHLADHKSPLQSAITFSTAPIVHLIAAKMKEKGEPISAISLVTASYLNKVTKLRHLLNANADVNSAHMKVTPLYIAATKGNTNATKLLINHGAKVEQEKDNITGYGRTPLYALVFEMVNSDNPDDESKREVVKLLVDNGASIKRKDPWSRASVLYLVRSQKQDALCIQPHCCQGSVAPLLCALLYELDTAKEKESENVDTAKEKESEDVDETIDGRVSTAGPRSNPFWWIYDEDLSAYYRIEFFDDYQKVRAHFDEGQGRSVIMRVIGEAHKKKQSAGRTGGGSSSGSSSSGEEMAEVTIIRLQQVRSGEEEEQHEPKDYTVVPYDRDPHSHFIDSLIEKIHQRRDGWYPVNYDHEIHDNDHE